MTDQNKRALIFFACLVAVALLLHKAFRDRQAAAMEVIEPAPGGDFYAPYYYTTPGIPDDPRILNGDNTPWQSVINISIDNPALAGLNNQYIPIFGLVGMTAVGE